MVGVFGFAIGAVPVGILTFPVSGFALFAGASVGATPTDGLSTASLWVSYVQPLMYFGLLGALGGIVFWAVLTCSGYAARHVSMRLMRSAFAQRPQSGRRLPDVRLETK